MSSLMAAGSSSEAAGGTFSRQGTGDHERKIPIYFRLVQKDIWMRMHVDTRSTIGAIKDAFLERIEMAPHDPSLQVTFYDEARWAMARQNTTQLEARYLPKAFVARAPKRNIKELLKVETDIDAASLFTSASAKLGARRTPSAKSVPASAQARAILGNDAGVGGRGTLGFVSANLMFDDDASQFETSSVRPISSIKTNRSPATPLTSALAHDAHSSNRSRDKLTNRFLPSGSSFKRLQGRTNNIDVQEMSAIPSQDTPPTVRSLNTPDISALVASGIVDAEAMQKWYGRLPGNEDALRLEREAMSTLQTPNDRQADTGAPDTGTSVRAIETERCAAVQGSDLFDGQVMEHNVDSNDSVTEREGERMAVPITDSHQSSDSSAADDVLGQDTNVVDGIEAHPDSSSAASEKGANLASQMVGERARSGTIVPSEAQRRAAMHASAVLQGSSTPSTIATMSSTDNPISDADLMKLPAPHLIVDDQPAHSGSHRAEQMSASAANNSASVNAMPPASRRLAGIHTDEISSWRDAQHGQARHFAIHSFSNGHILEDWRTVAAMRLRPYELLEVQNVDIRDKVHLPRTGEATNVCTRKGLAKAEKEDIATSFGPIPSSSNPALHADYLEPYAEAWAYIFKRGSGTSRTQRAGLGLWKLRWICLHSNRIFVFRSKPPRFAFDEAIMVWNLDCVDTVFAERADGATRPYLPIMTGQCQDILSITFRPSLGPNSTFEENIDYSQLSVSIRFITQLDHCAFFRMCSRAHFRAALRRTDERNASMVFEWRRTALARATIAGMGGTVMPGKAARRGGRNALSRTRLRPPGIKREFDDADRWSSDSEMEDFVPKPSVSLNAERAAFHYAEAALACQPLNMEPSGLPAMPAASGLHSSSHFKIGSPDSSVTGQIPTTPVVSSSWAMPQGSASRQRGFTTSAANSTMASSLKAPNDASLSHDASPTQARLQHAISMRSLTSQGGVGLGVIANGESINSKVPLPAPSLTTSPTVKHTHGQEQTTEKDSSLVTPSPSFTSSLDPPRPIVSPELELEQSPAAQAIHSFLAQRSSSRSSNLSRSRSATVATPPTLDVHRFTPDMSANGEGSADYQPFFSFDRQRHNFPAHPVKQSPSLIAPSSPVVQANQ